MTVAARESMIPPERGRAARVNAARIRIFVGQAGCGLIVVLSIVLALALALLLLRACLQPERAPLPVLPRVPVLPREHAAPRLLQGRSWLTQRSRPEGPGAEHASSQPR